MTIRRTYLEPITAALQDHGIVVVSGARGLGIHDTVLAALDDLPEGEAWELDGDGHTHGYLAGFEPFIQRLVDETEQTHPALVARHEHSLKRIWPHRDSGAFQFPRDLTSTSLRDERTRFYHHEYQNKILFGLAEYIVEALTAIGKRATLVIENGDRLPPTSRNLLAILQRLRAVPDSLSVALLDRSGTAQFDGAPRIDVPPLSKEEFESVMGFSHLGPAQREVVFHQSGGNPLVTKTLATCLGKEFGKATTLPLSTIIDLYLGTLDERDRMALAIDLAAVGSDPISKRNAETYSSARMDDLHHAQHILALELYMAGKGPLVLIHALSIRNPLRRLEALVEPCDVLMGIGLYDTWFEFFAPMFSSPALRSQGSGDDPINGLFINAAFVLYSMGYTTAALAFLDEFLTKFTESRFVPTALYAQSMTYGRYQLPVNLPAAEYCAVRNLQIIDDKFADHPRYTYIKVFAENAYAYIKARQGKFDEALELCERGISEIVDAYGEEQFQLHRSILIYNTSQVYELVDDPARAEQRLRAAIDCDPFYAEYYNDLGNLLSRLEGREDEALAAYAQAISLSPPYYEAHLNRGILRAQRDDRQGAKADFERALKIKPCEWRAHRELGNLSLAAGDHAGALTAYDEALRHEDHDADLHANAGVAASELGDSLRAIRHGEAAVAIQPRHASAHNNLAAEFTALGKLDKALHHIRLATAHDANPQYQQNQTAIMHLLH